MDVWRITVAALRRWYIFLPLLLATGLGAYLVGQGVNPQYDVRATAVLVPGPQPSDVANPYGTLDNTNQVLSIVLDATTTRDALEAQGLNREYEAIPRARSSILDVTVLGDTPEEGLATTDAVLDWAREELNTRQVEAGIPQESQVTLQILQAPTVTDVVAEGRLRNMAIVGIMGAAFSLLVAVLFDDLMGLFKRWLRKRREAKAAKTAVLPEQGEEPETVVAAPRPSDEGLEAASAQADAEDPPPSSTLEWTATKR